MKTYRVYEAIRNLVGGIEGVGTGSHYVKASSAEGAAKLWWDENSFSDVDQGTVIVATDDDGDSAHFYPKE